MNAQITLHVLELAIILGTQYGVAGRVIAVYSLREYCMRSVYLWIVVVAISITAIVSQLSFFFIEPQAGISEGKVLVLKRTSEINFIDSPRGNCQRLYPNEDSLHCESRILPLLLESTHVLYELPFSPYFYEMTYQPTD
ncbi:DNA-directed RNA polymerase subunit beta/140 kD subunit [Yersinia aldovae]|nr:DNA-directed RNA polymerase subunit beta/140 kD subunit [Yersinia aldovae]